MAGITPHGFLPVRLGRAGGVPVLLQMLADQVELLDSIHGTRRQRFDRCSGPRAGRGWDGRVRAVRAGLTQRSSVRPS